MISRAVKLVGVCGVGLALSPAVHAASGVFLEVAVLDDTAVFAGDAVVVANNPSDNYLGGVTINGVTFDNTFDDGQWFGDLRYFDQSGGDAFPAGTSTAFADVMLHTTVGIDLNIFTIPGIQAGKDYTLQIFGAQQGVRRAMNMAISGAGIDGPSGDPGIWPASQTYGGDIPCTTQRVGGLPPIGGCGWELGDGDLAGNADYVVLDPSVESTFEALYFMFTATDSTDLVVEFIDTFAAHFTAFALVEGTPDLSLEGDLNGDGFVGIADLNIVLGDWNNNIPPGDPLADPSGDNFVGIADLNIVLGNWNAGTPPPPASAVVPEPASLALLGLGGLATLRRRH